ncbi:MAG: hypothetical protein HW397_297 [Dehalococcoidia bacterium]|nr:hypothetical protein [Dehalococcoidia bacterium]
MPIPFHDADDVSELGLAGFLKIDAPKPATFHGALFLTNARGEPVEFTYNRSETPNTFLCCFPLARGYPYFLRAWPTKSHSSYSARTYNLPYLSVVLHPLPRQRLTLRSKLRKQ